jgi:type I restriction enzyme S subunit
MFRRVKRVGFEEDQLLSVYRDFGVVPKASRDDNFNKPSEDLSPYQLVESGDLVINKMKAWQGSVAISQYRGIVSPAYFVYTPFHDANPKFLHYLFRSPPYIAGYLSLSKGIRVNQWDLEPQVHSRIPVLLPPPLEQHSIASFLDQETSKVDALISEQQRLIELLKEKRQAVISHAVTKGLNSDVRMKPSGVEWLGEVPEHWGLKPLKYLLLKQGLIRGPFGGDLKKEVFKPSGFKVYEQKNAIYRDHYLGDSYISTEKYQQMVRFRVLPGDYIMSCSGTIGRAYQLPPNAPEGIINQALLLLRFSEAFNPSYPSWIFESDFFANQILDNSQGGAMKNLVGMDVFKSIMLPVPPLEEQRSITEYLVAKICEVEAMLVEADRLIGLLQERRTALISAAVTGKIDVRNYASTQKDAA